MDDCRPGPEYRLTDLHQPDLLPIFRLPTLPPPPRTEDVTTVTGKDQPPATTLQSMIELLQAADTTSLSPLEPPKAYPENMTPLMQAITAQAPDILALSSEEKVQHKTRTKKRPAAPATAPARTPGTAPPSAFPAGDVHAFATPNDNEPSPDRATKRQRTSLKLNLVPTVKAAVAATPAEEAAALARQFTKALNAFCRFHGDALELPDEDVQLAAAAAAAAATEGEAQHGNSRSGDPSSSQTPHVQLRHPQSQQGGVSACTDEKKDEKEVEAKEELPAMASRDAARNNGARGGTSQLLADVRRLGDNILQLGNTSAMSTRALDREIQSRALRALRAVSIKGHHVLLEEGDEEKESHVASALAALEAAIAALRVCVASASGDGVALVSEKVVATALDTARFQLQHNVLPFHDARLRAATRPELGKSVSSLDMHNGTETGGPDGTAREPPGGGSPSKGKAKTARARGGANHIQQQRGLELPPALSIVTDRVQAVLTQLCDLVPAIKVPTAMLSPLVRTAVATLTVQHGVDALQVHAAALLAAIFKSHPDLRRTILDELFTNALPYYGSTKNPRRTLALGDGSDGCPLHVHILAGTILQLVQGAAEVPPADADVDAALKAYGKPVAAADHFWTLCLDRLPLARSVKAETDHDFAAVLSALVQDVLTAASLPQWPAATTLLVRLAYGLNSSRGLHHQDAVVRQVCVDLLGRILAALHANEASLTEDESWLQGVAQENEFDDSAVAAQELLLKYLSDGGQMALPASHSARRYWLVRCLSEDVKALMHDRHPDTPGSDIASVIDSADNEKVRDLLAKSWQRLEELEAVQFETGLGAADAVRLMRPVVRDAFSNARPAMLSWLLEMLDPRTQAPTTRSKAVKALADMAAADGSVLSLPPVQSAVERCLQDDSISVREASLALLGRHMGGDPELALQLLNTVIRAVDDAGASVRKCAIKILRDSAIAVPGFPRAADAACAVLARAADSEESVQTMVAKLFHGLWFSRRLETESHGVLVRPAEQRASLLAEVSAAAYEAGGPAIRLPMDSQHNLVNTLRAAMALSDAHAHAHQQHGKQRRAESNNAAVRDVADALLESLLALGAQGGGLNAASNGDHGDSNNNNNNNARNDHDHDQDQDDDDVDEDAATAPLLALHALSVAEASSVVPYDDPPRFLRVLAPHLKTSPDSQYPAELDRRRAAERLLCVLSIIDAVLDRLAHVDDSLGSLVDLPTDLINLINKHRYTQVVAAAVKCLAAFAKRSATAAHRLLSTAAVYFSWLQTPSKQSPNNLPRFLFILGQMCRHGADTFDKFSSGAGHGAAAGQAPYSGTSLPTCLALFTKYWRFAAAKQPQLEAQVQRCALEAVGQLAIARPLVLADAGSEAKAMLGNALRPSAPSALKLAALGALTELLQADAEALERRQHEQELGTGGTTPLKSGKKAVLSGSGSKRARGSGASTGSGKKRARLGKRAAYGEHGGYDDDDDETNGSEGNVDDEDVLQPAASGAVATENGEGDSLSQSSAVLQQHWEAVLALATESAFSSASSSSTGHRHNLNAAPGAALSQSALLAANDSLAVRRRVLALTEVVLRDGLVGPWTAVPALVAMCTDGAVDVRTRALRLLCQLSDKHPQYADAGRLSAGLDDAFRLHHGPLSRTTTTTKKTKTKGVGGLSNVGSGAHVDPTAIGFPAPTTAAAGIGALYAKLVQTSRPRRNEFLRAMMRTFRAALGAGSTSSGSLASPQLLEFVAGIAVSLPFKRAEEACILIQEASGMIASHADRVAMELSTQLESLEYNGDEDEGSADGEKKEMGWDASTAQRLSKACRAGAILCVLHRVRSFLERAYGISHERAAAFAAAGKRKTAEEGIAVTRSIDPLTEFRLTEVDWEARRSFETAKTLLNEMESMHNEDGDG